MSSNSFLFRHVRTLMFALTALPLVSHAAVETIAKGQLTYGTAATFMPFEYVKAGKLTGFDIDLINALSKEIQLTPAPMPMEFKGLIPALQGKRLDIINSAMYVNPTRAEQVDFVPYLKIGSRVVVRKGNPANITGRDLSLCGKNIAVTLGGIEESQARADNQRCVEAKKPAINVMTFPAAPIPPWPSPRDVPMPSSSPRRAPSPCLPKKPACSKRLAPSSKRILTSPLPCVKAIPQPRPCWSKVCRASSKMAPTRN